MLIWETLSLDTLGTTYAGPDAVFSLTDATRCALLRYGPRIAPRRAGTLGGGGDYDVVEDELEVLVLGATPARCAANAEALTGLLDQAARWWAGENVAPIQIRGLLQGSTVGELSALVLGAAPGQEPIAISPEPDVQLPTGPVVPYGMPLTLRLRRRPLWRGALGATVSGSSAAGNPAIATLAYAVDQGTVPAPTQLLADGTADLLNTGAGYLLWAPTTDALKLQDASTATASGYTTVADAANFPYQGTNVLRYTPTGTAFARSGVVLNNTALNRYTQWAILVAARNNSATTTFQVRAHIRYFSGGAVGDDLTTRAVVIDITTTNAQVVPLPLIPIAGNTATISLEVAASAASGTLDVSYVAMIALDAPSATVLQFGAAPSGFAAAFDLRYIQILHQDYGALRSPNVSRSASTPFLDAQGARIPYTGDAALGGVGSAAYAIYCQPQGAAWAVNSGGSKITVSYQSSRRPAYLTPQ